MKILKIAAAGLVTFALVTNLYSAVFSYYGIKTNNLEGVIWANSLATTDGSSSSTSTSVTSTSGSWGSAVNTTVHCGIMYYTGNTSNVFQGSASFTTNNQGQVSVSFSTNGGTSFTGSIAPHPATMVECVGPTFTIFCSDRSALTACGG